MADSEFDEFHRPIFETYSPFAKAAGNHKTNPQNFYSLIPNDDYLEDESSSSKSDASDQEDGDMSACELKETQKQSKSEQHKSDKEQVTVVQCNNAEDDELGDGLKVVPSLSSEGSTDTNYSFDSHHNHQLSIDTDALIASTKYPLDTQQQQQQRRRRKLPEIPKNKKSSILHLLGGNSVGGVGSGCNFARPDLLSSDHELHSKLTEHGSVSRSSNQRYFLSLKCGYLIDEDSSPDSERLQSLGDVDSGHSTAHSPNDFKSISPQVNSPTIQMQVHTQTQGLFQQPFGGVLFEQLEMLEATHRGLHKFIPRHHDEIEIEIGDGVYVQKEADDLWCEGVNLRTGRQGVFPSAYAVDLDYNEFDPAVQQVKKERYLLGYLGSVETLAHKGTGVVCQAVRKIVGEYGNSPMGQACILEVSDQGLRMVDRSGPNKKDKKPCIDYFYSLKNVSFCAFHPRDHRFIGFITKHPTVQRFACHVFKGSESTRPVAEAVGRAFQRFYQKFIETAYPIEDIYIE